jgi:hypothetical protein
MRDGTPMQPRPIHTIDYPPQGDRFEKVIAFSRASHMMPRKPVEERLAASFPKAPSKRPRHPRKRDPDQG